MVKPQYELEAKPIIEDSISSDTDLRVAPSVPCSMSAIQSGFGGGLLGYVFGFGQKLFSSRQLGACNGPAMQTAKQFAVIGALYSFVSCCAVRIRQKEDAWTAGVSGCATGLALSWSTGPSAAVRGCAVFGGLSAAIEMMNKNPAQAFTGLNSALLERRKTACGEGGCSILQPFSIERVLGNRSILK